MMIEGFQDRLRLPIEPDLDWVDFLAGLPSRLVSWMEDFHKLIGWIDLTAHYGSKGHFGLPPLDVGEVFDLGRVRAMLDHCWLLAERMWNTLRGCLPEYVDDKSLAVTIRSAPSGPDERYTHWDKEPYQEALNALQRVPPNVIPILDCSIRVLERAGRDVFTIFVPTFGFYRCGTAHAQTLYIFATSQVGQRQQALYYLSAIVGAAEELEMYARHARGLLAYVQRRVEQRTRRSSPSAQEARHDHTDPAA